MKKQFLNINPLDITIGTAFGRYIFMTLVVVALGFAGQMILAAITAFAMAFSCIVGLSFKVQLDHEKQPAKVVKKVVPKKVVATAEEVVVAA